MKNKEKESKFLPMLKEIIEEFARISALIVKYSYILLGIILFFYEFSLFIVYVIMLLASLWYNWEAK